MEESGGRTGSNELSSLFERIHSKVLKRVSLVQYLNTLFFFVCVFREMHCRRVTHTI